MVRWYDPSQLVATALQVAKSSLFAENADARLQQPGVQVANGEFIPPHFAFDDGDDLVVDFVADTGDGFDSTYAIARLTTMALDVGEPAPLPASSILVLGGDQVYPTASAESYERRFTAPYLLADKGADPKQRRHLFAIPGNHDWYDNLVSFTRLFIQGNQLGGWRSPQRRSYFALALPHGWWLLATDVQLGSDIDDLQDAYFRDVAARLPADASIILCHAEPHWVFDNEALKGDKASIRGTRVAELETALDGGTQRIRVMLAGDLHHYRRHVGKLPHLVGEARTLVTAGGGGAFLHPTHGWRDGSDEELAEWASGTRAGIAEYRCEQSYPAPQVSRGLTKRVAFGVLENSPSFAYASAAVYGILALNLLLGARTACTTADCEGAWVQGLLTPGTITWAALIVGAFVLATDTSSRAYRIGAGTLHGLAHAIAAVAVPSLFACYGGHWFVGRAFSDAAADHALAFFAFLGSLAASVVAGGLVGGFFMGLYLWASLNVFGRHRNEAFSALGMDGYKSFVRMRIDPAGELTLFALGLDSVPKRWEPRPEHARDVAPRPADITGSPKLIEKVKIPRCPGQT